LVLRLNVVTLPVPSAPPVPPDGGREPLTPNKPPMASDRMAGDKATEWLQGGPRQYGAAHVAQGAGAAAAPRSEEPGLQELLQRALAASTAAAAPAEAVALFSLLLGLAEERLTDGGVVQLREHSHRDDHQRGVVRTG